MTKFLLGTIATLLLTLTFFIYKHNKTLQDLEHEKYKNLSLESKLQDSNKALEKIQLDTQSYLKGRDKEIQQIQNKYTKLLQEHTRQERAKHATQNHISSQVKLDNSYNATDTSKKSVSKHSLHTQNRDVSAITYPQHDTKDQDMMSSHSEGVLQSKTTEESNNKRCFANAQHDVCFLSQYDVDVSGLSPQHHTKDQDIRTRHSEALAEESNHDSSHSEGVLQNKTTENLMQNLKIKI